jgi:hypothetical protein
MPRDLPDVWLAPFGAVFLNLARERPPTARRPECSRIRSWPTTPPSEEEA